MLPFVSAGDSAAFLVFHVPNHYLAAPVGVSFRSSNLVLYDRPYRTRNGLVGIFVCHSRGIDRAVECIGFGRRYWRVSREYVRYRLRGPFSASVG
jgi:hypothetical protein